MQDVAIRFEGNSFKDRILKFILDVGVYFISKERNARLFLWKSKDVSNILQDIVLNVRLRAYLLTEVVLSGSNSSIANSWTFLIIFGSLAM